MRLRDIFIIQKQLFEGFKEARLEFTRQADDVQVDAKLAAYRDLVNRNQVQGNERNIDFWRKRGWDDFVKFVDAKSSIPSATQTKRNKIAGKSVTIFENSEWLVVVPIDKKASCYHGKNTDWCTTKQHQAHFENYVYSQDVVLVYFLQLNTGKKWAIAVHQRTDEIECFDINDTSLPPEQFQQQTGFNPKEYAKKALLNPDVTTQMTASKEEMKRMRQLILAHEPFTEESRELEQALLFVKDVEFIYQYIRKVKGPWKEAEPIIMRDPSTAVAYASSVLRQRWSAAEKYIIQSPQYAVEYAIFVIKGRWPEAEEYIRQSPAEWRSYVEELKIIEARKQKEAELSKRREMAAQRRAQRVPS